MFLTSRPSSLPEDFRHTTQTYINVLPGPSLLMDVETTLACRDKARNHLKVADHVLTMSYPLLKDSKLLLSVIDNLNLAASSALASVLHNEHARRRTPPCPSGTKEMIALLRSKVPPVKLNPDWLVFMEELDDLASRHKSAATAFRRKGAYVMADDQYHLTALDDKMLKKHLATTKEVVFGLLTMVNDNAAMPGRR